MANEAKSDLGQGTPDFLIGVVAPARVHWLAIARTETGGLTVRIYARR
jgi:hypothetical protein